MNSKSHYPLPVATVTIPRRGRGKPFQVEVIGRRLPDGKVDTTVAKGQLTAAIEIAQKFGEDPAQLIVEGHNARQVDQNRKQQPSFERSLVERGLVHEGKEARLAALHIGQTAKLLGADKEAVASTLVRLVTKEGGGESEEPAIPEAEYRPPIGTD